MFYRHWSRIKAGRILTPGLQSQEGTLAYILANTVCKMYTVFVQYQIFIVHKIIMIIDNYCIVIMFTLIIDMPVKQYHTTLQILLYSGSGSEGSNGTHPVLVYVDVRPRPYLVEV